MTLKKTIQDIKSLKIQGAENVSTKALEAVKEQIKKSKPKSNIELFMELEKSKQLLINTRPTEPQLRNYLNAIQIITKKAPNQTKQELIKKISKLLKQKIKSKKQIVNNGKKLIKKNFIVYTHCHSSSVTSILITMKKNLKEVHNTETRPLYQGRITSKELAQHKIKVIEFIDSEMLSAMKDANLILIGADAITEQGLYNKVGSEEIAIIAKEKNIPLYSCASLWKFDCKEEIIEERSEQEVWAHHPKNIHIENPAFDKVPLNLIKGIICEKGILTPKKFLQEAKRIIKC
jgi:ribose 1,5-bisphosphate isomerase